MALTQLGLLEHRPKPRHLFNATNLGHEKRILLLLPFSWLALQRTGIIRIVSYCLRSSIWQELVKRRTIWNFLLLFFCQITDLSHRNIPLQRSTIHHKDQKEYKQLWVSDDKQCKITCFILHISEFVYYSDSLPHWFL